MKNLFDTEYYDEQADEEKPEFPDLDDELELGIKYFTLGFLIHIL
jgi:hypothetical protein